MARKRMFDNEIISQDSFVDLPSEAKALYFLLGMEADDEGFVAPKKVLRWHNISLDSLKLLIAKDYLIAFESGVVVITDWKVNNYLNKTKVRPTIYVAEKNQLCFDEENGRYYLLSNSTGSMVGLKLAESSNKVGEKLAQNRIEENSIEENRVVKKESKKKDCRQSFDSIIENYTQNVELQDELKNHLKVRKQKRGALTDRAIELELKRLDDLTDDEETKLRIVQQSVERGWVGFFELKEDTPKAISREEKDMKDIAMYEAIEKEMKEGVRNDFW